MKHDFFDLLIMPRQIPLFITLWYVYIIISALRLVFGVGSDHRTQLICWLLFSWMSSLRAVVGVNSMDTCIYTTSLIITLWYDNLAIRYFVCMACLNDSVSLIRILYSIFGRCFRYFHCLLCTYSTTVEKAFIYILSWNSHYTLYITCCVLLW